MKLFGEEVLGSLRAAHETLLDHRDRLDAAIAALEEVLDIEGSAGRLPLESNRKEHKDGPKLPKHDYKSKILSALSICNLKTEELHQEVGGTRDGLNGALSKLAEKGEIVRIVHGLYGLPSDPAEALEPDLTVEEEEP